MTGLYFEDYTIGAVFETGQREISAKDVETFAELSGDKNPLHTDTGFAQTTDYKALIAHGLLGISALTGLLDELGLGRGTALAFLGIEEWHFKKPIFLGDTIRGEITISDARLSRSNPARGIVTRDCQIFNQRNELVQHGKMIGLIRCRESDS